VAEQPRGDGLVLEFAAGVVVVFITAFSRCCFPRAADVNEVLLQSGAPLEALGLAGERAAGFGRVGADLAGFFVVVERGRGRG